MYFFFQTDGRQWSGSCSISLKNSLSIQFLHMNQNFLDFNFQISPFIAVPFPPSHYRSIFFCWTKSVSNISKEHHTLTLGSKVNNKHQLAFYFHRALTFLKRKVLLIYFGSNFRKLGRTAEKGRKKYNTRSLFSTSAVLYHVLCIFNYLPRTC